MAAWPYGTATWRHLRAAKLSVNPLCEPCDWRGVHREANAVDHIVSIASGGPSFPPLDGLRSMCTPCHSIKTAGLDRAGGKGVAFKGCDPDGLPLDPDHPFLIAGGYPLEGLEADQIGPPGDRQKQLVRDWGV